MQPRPYARQLGAACGLVMVAMAVALVAVAPGSDIPRGAVLCCWLAVLALCMVARIGVGRVVEALLNRGVVLGCLSCWWAMGRS